MLLCLIYSNTFANFSQNKVIYGADNRGELSDSPKSFLSQSVLAQVSRYDLIDTGEDFFAYLLNDLTTYRDRPTCQDMPFRAQSTLATCTGFLIAEDLVVTAGHCVLEEDQYATNTYTHGCSQSYWVFNYGVDSITGDSLELPYEDVYQCDRVIDGAYKDHKDYAIIRLRRKTIGKKPLTLNLNFDYKKNESVYVVGHPTGLPAKISDQAVIKDEPSKYFFVSDLDTFAGNSGSPIFNDQDEVIGILVSGEVDYHLNEEENCYSVNHCQGVGSSCSSPDVDTASGETGTKITVLNRYFNKQANKK